MLPVDVNLSKNGADGADGAAAAAGSSPSVAKPQPAINGGVIHDMGIGVEVLEAVGGDVDVGCRCRYRKHR